MIRIPNIEQIREWDRITISRQGISSLDLMERAANAFVSVFIKNYKICNVTAVCGKGNNGADGLAILRLLRDRGFECTALLIGSSEKESEDFRLNLQRLPKEIAAKQITHAGDIDFSYTDIVIDGVFGSGLSRKPEGLFAEVIQKINSSGKIIISIDIPSGLLADTSTSWPVVQAHHTITFQTHKLSFLMPSAAPVTGKVDVADILLDSDYGRGIQSDYFLLQQEDIRKMIPVRLRHAHKGNFGHALIMAGSYGMMGAAVLTTHAALRTGAGKVTAAIPSGGTVILQSSVPEAMVIPDHSEKDLTVLPDLKNFNAVAIGPGIGTSMETSNVLSRLLEAAFIPVVIDADALNLLSMNTGLISLLSSNHILTPHPGEFRRLAGEWKDDFDRLELLKKFAKKTGSVIILKGTFTSIAFPSGQVYFNPTGNPYMATAGSGDVLTGVIVSLLAQGIDIRQAAMAGVYLHGFAGDIAAGKGHPILAGDIINALPAAWDHTFNDY